MGLPMAGHIIDAGHKLAVYSRTNAKALPLLERGAIWMDSPEEVAAWADTVITMVGHPADVEEVYLGKKGIINSARPGLTCVDMTTTSPSLDIKIAGLLKEKGAAFSDAPVSGGDRGAREAALTIMAGAEKEVFDSLLPIFEALGKTITHCGAVGMGQRTKLCNQMVIAGTMMGVSEALAYADASGLDLSTMLGAISGGAAGCWTLDNLAPRVVGGDYEPGFMVEHFTKDMRIGISENEALGLPAEALRLACGMYSSLEAEGLGRKGTQILVEHVSKGRFGKGGQEDKG